MINYIPPSRVKLALFAFLLAIGLIVLNKFCNGRYMQNILDFNKFITPCFEPLKSCFKPEKAIPI